MEEPANNDAASTYRKRPSIDYDFYRAAAANERRTAIAAFPGELAGPARRLLATMLSVLRHAVPSRRGKRWPQTTSLLAGGDRGGTLWTSSISPKPSNRASTV